MISIRKPSTRARTMTCGSLIHLLTVLLALPVFGFRADDRSGAGAIVRAETQAVRTVSREQGRIAGLAKAAGVELRWNPELGAPLSVRGTDLGARASFSSGKGLRVSPQAAAPRNAIAVLDNLAGLFGIKDAGAEFETRAESGDRLGFRHVRLRQMHRGLRVAGGELVVHFNQAGQAYEVNGRYVPDIDVAPEAVLTADGALRIAAKELALRARVEAVLTEGPELIVHAVDGPPRLAYALTLSYADPVAGPGRWRYTVGANDGALLRCYNDIPKIAPPSTSGSHVTLYGNLLNGEGGSYTNVTGWLESNGTHYLYNKNSSWYIYNVAVSGWTDNNTYAYRAVADWTASDRAEVSGAVWFDYTQRYYLNVHGLDSYDGAAHYARANVHKDINYVNAYWDGSAFYFGDGNGVNANALVVADVVAHEFTHAVTEYSSNLAYANEPGALNESFSDILGACVEFRFQPDGRAAYPGSLAGHADWLLGEDCWLSSAALRDMRAPGNAATVGVDGVQPSRYRGSNWYSGTEDSGGVHINSGVQNFFFYLLCEGGTGNNDGLDYDVSGIGVANAEQIAYRALTLYCTPSTGYRAAMSAWLSAAQDLDAGWADSVLAAWDAVGISAVGITPATEVIFSGPVGGPFGPATNTFTLTNDGLASVDWSLVSSQPWDVITPLNGTLAGGASATVAVSVNTAALALPMGLYTDALLFSNSASLNPQQRNVVLRVGQIDYYTELFSANDNDLAYTTLTFTPDGSTSHYAVCTAPAADFAVETNGATVLVVDDDESLALDLAGGAVFPFYGTPYQRLYLGSNGYITFGAGDYYMIESLSMHFNLPRISALFDDIDPSAGGTVSWQQLADRVVITFENVPQWDLGDSSSFQYELFFDGTIRITFLELDAPDGLTGLSRGMGVPGDFVESDLSFYGICLPPDALRVSPMTGLAAGGYVGGPFSPSSKVYTIDNIGSNVLLWTAACTSDWVTVTPGSGNVPVGQAVPVEVAVNAAAATLAAGHYDAQVTFANQDSGFATPRAVALTVRPIPGDILVLDSIAPSNDLAMSFGELIIGRSRTEQVTIHNTNAVHDLIVSGLRLAKPAAVSIPPFTGAAVTGSGPVSVGRAPRSSGAPAAVRALNNGPSAVACYGIDMVGDRLVSFSSTNAAVLSTVAASGANLIPSVEFLSGDFSRLYAIDFDASQLITFNTTTGVKTVIGPLIAAAGHVWTGLAADPTDGTLYACSTDTSVAKLYTVDPINGATTLVGNLTNAPGLIDISINSAGEMFGVDIADDTLVAIDTATGEGRVVGALGVDANYAQGMDFDERNNILYWAAYSSVGELRVIDTLSGASALVEAFPAGTELCMAVADGGVGAFILTNLPALPYAIPPGGSVAVDVIFQPILARGISAALEIESNDDDQPVVEVGLSGTGIVDYIRLDPATGFAVSGHPGGPLSPSNTTYALCNSGPVTVDWVAASADPWLDVAPAAGTLTAGMCTTVTVSLATSAELLGEGIYNGAIAFSNLTTGINQVRGAELTLFTTPEIQVSPAAGFWVTNRIGQAVTRTVVVSNAATADGQLDFSARVRETGRNIASLTSAVASRIGSDLTQPAKGAAYREGRLLVRFRSGIPAADRQNLVSGLGGRAIARDYRLVPGLCLVELAVGTRVETALLGFNGAQDVLYAQPDYIWQAENTPNDPGFGDQWGMHNTGQTGGTPDADIDAAEAWDVATGHDGIVVAVIDTGVDYTHPDLNDNMWINLGEVPGNALDDDGNGYVDDVYGYDFVNGDGDPMDDHYHGTHCAGTVGAEGNNGEGVVGVCWDVRIMALKFLDSTGYGSTADAIGCVEYAALMEAKVLSNSWGGGPYDQALKDAIDAVAWLDVPFVAAAGNDGTDNDTIPHYPSSYDSANVIAVVNTDHSDAKASSSSYGLVSTDLAAPGTSIISCKPGGYLYLSGTSMATPHVAGACALMLSVNPMLSATDMKQTLMDTVDPTLSGVCASGGRLNLARALGQVGAPWLGVTPSNVSGMLPGSASNMTVTFDATEMLAGTYTGEVVIASNDPLHPRITVPAIMTVLPAQLALTPSAGFETHGEPWGPFMPPSMSYQLSNSSPAAVTWSAACPAVWVDVTPAAGVLAAGAAVPVVLKINGMAAGLDIGWHGSEVVFSNHVNGVIQTRAVNLDLHPAIPTDLICFDLASDPGWTTEGDWAYGQPQGNAGDPVAGHTGNNVYGYALQGAYTNDMPRYYLTTTAMDCRAYTNLSLRFWRWLGVEYGDFDHAGIEVSNDGATWQSVWNNAAVQIEDTVWQQQAYDISATADGEETVYLRWAMGTTDFTEVFCGWNIDDICLRGNRVFTPQRVPVEWLIVHGVTNGGSWAAAELTDDDHDGMPAWEEFYADTRPDDPGSVLRVIGVQVSGGNVHVTWQGGMLATQVLVYGASLLSNDWAAVYTNLPPTPVTNTLLQPGGDGFYSIRIDR